MKQQKQTLTKQQLDGLLENVAAISGELWSTRKFYERFCDDLSGFPGVWRYSITAAEAFSKAEERFGKEIGKKPKESYEYLDAILPFAEWLRDVTTLPTTSRLQAKAWDCVLAAKHDPVRIGRKNEEH